MGTQQMIWKADTAGLPKPRFPSTKRRPPCPAPKKAAPQNLKAELRRLATFARYPKDLPCSAIYLASQGFAYTGMGSPRDDTITCVFCSSTLSHLGSHGGVDFRHRTASPRCPAVDKQTDGHSDGASHPTQGSGHPTQGSGHPTQAPFLAHNYESQTFRQGDEASSPTSQPPYPTAIVSNVRSDSIPAAVPPSSTTPRSTSPRGGPSENEGTTPPSSSRPSQPDNERHVSSSDQSVPSNPNANNSNNPTSQPDSNPTPPADSNNPTPPADSNNPTPPADSNNPTPPADSNNPTPPADSNNPTPPADSNNPAPPADSNNGDQGVNHEALGICTAKAKRPEYAVEVTRLKSFEKWPPKHHIRPQDLAKAGFFFAGYSDCARCFHCAGGLRNWELGDNVWVEHARWFRKCAFIRQMLGVQFVEVVQEMNRNREIISYQDVVDEMKRKGLDNEIPLDSATRMGRNPSVVAVANFGYDKKDAVVCAQKLKDSGQSVSADLLFEELVRIKAKRTLPRSMNQNAVQTVSLSRTKNRDKESLRSSLEKLKMEISDLRQRSMCKICLDEELSVMFLPCGHLVSCVACAFALNVCPICREDIQGSIRVFLPQTKEGS